MLSRTADNLYWLARYVERAEYLARILEATQRAHRDAAGLVGDDQRMGIGARDRGLRRRASSPHHEEANEETVTDFLAFSPRTRPRSATASRRRAPTRARCAPR